MQYLIHVTVLDSLRTLRFPFSPKSICSGDEINQTGHVILCIALLFRIVFTTTVIFP